MTSVPLAAGSTTRLLRFRQLSGELNVQCADAVRSASVRLLLANLTADVITDLFPEFNRVLQRSGMAILSGILLEQGEEVRKSITVHQYNIFEEITRGEWLALVVEKHVS